ncbi:hypothetical protein [Carnobacterium divergens]|uniref:hypothetical protein n=1 Tax=Carnobacterium divergens TaxID=2748 RepID=UPI0007F3AF0E|nr:hypothetical protein [Carnobacterium divergens]SBO17670.1 hypothetical protein CDIV41_320232 [Carnobacterium divergens]
MKLFVMFGTIFLISLFAISGCNRNQPEEKYNGLVFKTKLRDRPQKFKDTDTYILDFDTIDIVHDKDDILKKSFNNGGTLNLSTHQLPADASIKKGTKIVVHLKKNFATTRSIPPQVLEDGVIKVEFNL